MEIFTLLSGRDFVELHKVQCSEAVVLNKFAVEPGLESEIYDWRLFGGDCLTIRRPSLARAHFLQSDDGGRTFIEVSAVPGESLLELYKCQAHRSGILTAVDGNIIWIKHPNNENWTHEVMPDKFSVESVSFDGEGRMHIVGSVSSNNILRNGTEAAYAIFENGELNFIHLSMEKKDRELLVKKGGASKFLQIDASELPILVSTDCDDFLDDSSSFLLVGSKRGVRVSLLKDEFALSFERSDDDSVLFITDCARLYSTRNGGEQWHKEDLLKAISKVWPNIRSHKLKLMSSYSEGEEIFLAITAFNNEAIQSFEGSTIVYSNDRGSTFKVVESVNEPYKFFRHFQRKN